jgi:hypothetical protein
MIWLTWRQLRVQAIAGAAVLAAVVAVYLATAPSLHDLARSSGFAACPTCEPAAKEFLAETAGGMPGFLYRAGLILVLLLPALVGLFWGAPLIAREFEGGTQRLVWNQSVTRRRWLAVKLAGVAAAAAVLGGLASLAIGWWAAPLDRLHQNRMEPDIFAARGVVPVACAVLAVVVGVTLGLVVRRTVPAMALTLLVVVAAQVASPLLLRPHLSTPMTYTKALTSADIGGLQIHNSKSVHVDARVPMSGAWVLHNDAITSSGAVFTGPPNPAACGPAAAFKACPEWLSTLGLRVRVVYMPPDRFWRLQWRESGVLLAVAGLLSLGCFWWIRRRVT